ncbi:hypothetical protein PS918_00407 [Pseudomonas fluorescens]|uniref:RHS repeat-associated core domain-containing protein n=1 Tax=Pseudomonas fluorescens TaxID=294 RepID=A0A5E7QXS5_PSEFL|nr:hypothetical protein PS918_00407 [Pseudomonas fluorescens]
MSSTTLLATDQQRSVVNTLKANHPPQPIAYSPYGHCPAICGFFSLLGFNGELRDPVTGHYLLGKGYRAFIPALMRFNRPDNLSPFDEGGLNPYAYCFGDPTNLQDPNGRSPIGHWRAITRRLMATTDFKSRIAELQATRLIAEQPNLSALIKLKHQKIFEELHANAQKTYNPNTKVQKLEL